MYYPQNGPTYNQATSGLFPQGTPYPAQNFIYLSGMYSTLGGGWSGGGGYPTNTSTGYFFNAPKQYDIKPTFNTTATWVKGNHTFKMGATALFEGLPTTTTGRAQGEYGFSQVETSDPWQFGLPFTTTASSGFGYASFFLGLATAEPIGRIADLRLGYHSFGLYAQDSWKITRKLTFDYGLRWDYANLWNEEYGRMQSAGFNLPNSTVGGRLGAPEYQATCNCQFAHAYPLSIGPHLGVAYQITPKTVFRAGAAITYGSQADDAGVNHSAADYLQLGTPAYGAPAALLKYGDTYAPGNVLGNPVLVWPTSFLSKPYSPAPTASGIIPPAAPFISIASQRGPVAAHLSMEHRPPAGDYAKPGGGCSLRGESWRMVGGPGKRRAELQRAPTPDFAIPVRNQRDQHRGRKASQHPHQFAPGPGSLPEPDQSEQRLPGIPRDSNAGSGAAALPAVDRHSAVPGAAHGRYLVRFAPDQGDQAVFARPKRVGCLYLGEGAYRRYQLQHLLPHALPAAHQRCLQLSAE